jgi:hypothetical protein
MWARGFNEHPLMHGWGVAGDGEEWTLNQSINQSLNRQLGQREI